MARLIFPLTFEDKTKLFGLVFAKNADDGVDSILLPYFTQNTIDMDDDAIEVGKAVDANKLFDKKSKESEKLLEQCKAKLAPFVKQYRDIGQMLKKFYRKTPHVLGDFGYTIVGNRIVYKSDRDDMCNAISEMITYNAGLAPGTSPITTVYLTQNEIDLTLMAAAMPDIILINAAFTAAQTISETQSALRDTLIAPIAEHLRGIGGFVISQFTKTPKSAGDWGYTIDDSPQAAKLTVGKFKEAEIKIVYQAVAGSIVQVTGPGSLTITKGEEGTGTPVVLNFGDHWREVAPGYTTMTVNNPSLTEKSELTYMKN